MNLQERITTRVQQLIASSDELKLTIPAFNIKDVWKNAQLATISIVQVTEEEAVGKTGVEKKMLAMAAASMFYDIVVANIAIPYVPVSLNRTAHKGIKILYLKAIDGAIDASVATLRKIGVFKKG